MKTDYKKQGKKNKRKGGVFELKVRKNLENKGWVVSKWQNNVEFEEFPDESGTPFKGEGKLIPAKRKFNPFNKALTLGTGFPDFVKYQKVEKPKIPGLVQGITYFVEGVEVKSNGYLDKEEKEKCKWLIENNIFSRILIASKDKNKRGGIVYKEYGAI